jgi:hypothetical protein
MITSATFIENIVLFIRDKLRDQITDPISRAGNGTSFVFTSYPKVEVQYPIITVKQLNLQTRKLGMSSETHFATIGLEVRIWARNSKECDELSSDVIDALRTAEYGSGGTNVEGINGFQITSMVPLVELSGDNSIHSKILGVKYSAILS